MGGNQVAWASLAQILSPERQNIEKWSEPRHQGQPSWGKSWLLLFRLFLAV